MSDLPHSHPTFEELHKRIWEDLMHYGGPTLIQAALVWHGYLGALYEWEVISLADYEQLVRLLPRIEDNPMRRIFLGWPEPSEEEDE